MRIVLLLFAFLWFISIFAADGEKDKKDSHEKKESAAMEWGSTLLSSSGFVTPLNKIQGEVWFIDANVTRAYNGSWDTVPLHHTNRMAAEIRTRWGFAEKFDFGVFTTKFFGQSAHKSDIEWGDSSLGVSYQMYQEKDIFGVRLTLAMQIPSGNFDRLDEELDAIDDTGVGAYALQIALAVQKSGEIGKLQYRWRYNFRFFIPADAPISGHSHFGGGKRTIGEVKVGQVFTFIWCYDLALSQRWIIGTEWQYLHRNRSTFHGQLGFTPDGLPAVIGSPSSELFVLDAALKYVIPKVVRFQLGVWASVAGRKAQAFVGPFFSCEHTY